MMIKKVYKLGILTSAALLFLLAGCNDQFMKDKKNYNLITPEFVYEDYASAITRVNFIHSRCMNGPGSGIASKVLEKVNEYGQSSFRSKSTEEYGGIDDGTTKNYWICAPTDRDQPWSEAGNWDYFHIEGKPDEGIWGMVREINDFLQKMEENRANFSTDEYNLLVGQAYFWRAWCYYSVVKIMGGIPIVKTVLPPIGMTDENKIPRSTTKACIDFICDDLQTAYNMLPEEWDNPQVNYGRITSGAALALMGRARLLYASPLFNRANNLERWQEAYEVNKKAKNELMYAMTPGTNASGWAIGFAPAQLFHDEFVLVGMYTDGATGRKSNSWENTIRPNNIKGKTDGGIRPTAEMVDLFPMSDGKLPNTRLNQGKYSNLDYSDKIYDSLLFWLDRDPRFYRTFAFPGVRWTSGANLQRFRNDTTGIYLFPYDGKDYEFWGYAWYSYDGTSGDHDDWSQVYRDNQNMTTNSWGADGTGSNGADKTVLLRKRSNDYDLENSMQYEFITDGNYSRSWTPYPEIRFGEVLLNFAESACGANKGDEALQALRMLRQRVGYTGDCGLNDDLALTANKAALFSAILYERQIELAYEGKRFDDIRRWMLWDGGIDQDVIGGASWRLSGWGATANTCDYLGVAPLKGTRRHGIQVYSVRIGNRRANNQKVAEWIGTEQVLVEQIYDPIMIADTSGVVTAKRPEAIDLMNNKMDRSDAVTAAVADFWTYNFSVKRPDNLDPYTEDGTEPDVYPVKKEDTGTIQNSPWMYFLGLTKNAQSNNAFLLQTLGWVDLTGHDGQWFDPIAE